MSQKENKCSTCNGQSQGGACGCHHCKDCDTYYSCYGFSAPNYSRFLEKMKDVPIINSDILYTTGWNTGDGTFKMDDLWSSRPNYFDHDPTNGADKIATDILFDIECRVTEPLEDQSLRDDEMKEAILSHLKKLLREAADGLENDGY